MIWVLLLVAVVILLYFLALQPCSYWNKKNVQTGKVVPIFGDNYLMILGRESLTQMIQRVYDIKQDVRYIGGYQFQTPFLLLKSPEIIKKVCVKDFDSFMNHRSFFPDDVDELWSKNLVILRGQTWKNMRSNLSPSFTSSKMKLMFVLISHNAKLFVQHFLDKDVQLLKVEVQDAYRRYTNDVIASTAFGLEVNSLVHRENEFYVMGGNASDFSTPKKKLKFFLFQFSPLISKLFGVSFLEEKERSFFVNLVRDTIKLREERDIKRPDMLGILLEARKEKLKGNISDGNKKAAEAEVNECVTHPLTDGDIAAQAFIFFIAGYESVSLQMCFMAYELAVNPDVQKKLIEEVDKNMPENGIPSYETILNMAYLDMVVCESMRKWPISVVTDRVVTKPYTIQPELSSEKPLHLEMGVSVMIPIFAIHRDPKYYQNPEKFDPERFSPENRMKLDPYTYIPFGVGPRNCIGSRFALLEIKAVFFYLLSHFEIVPVEETQIPLRISRSALKLQPENKFPLGFKRRN